MSHVSQISQIQLRAETLRLRAMVAALETRLTNLDRQLHERNGAEGSGIDIDATVSQTILILQNAVSILETQLANQWASQLKTFRLISESSIFKTIGSKIGTLYCQGCESGQDLKDLFGDIWCGSTKICDHVT